jgi:hypothetical protein
MSGKKQVENLSSTRARASMSTIDKNSTPEVHCKHSKMERVENLRENPRNYNKHSDKQIALLAKNIRHLGWRHPIIISGLTNFIVAGHARLQAAKLLNLSEVPVDVQPFNSETEELAYLIADNRIAELAEVDNAMLSGLLADEAIFEGFDMDLTGFDEEALGGLLDDGDPPADDTYTNKIIAPVYEPKGENPPLNTLIDREKTDRLKAEIEAADIPDDIAGFLKDAAERHTVFHFGRIAEFYCHASPVVQDLMEKSGMIIIDFKKAIEYGFVHLTERLGALADLEEGGENEG